MSRSAPTDSARIAFLGGAGPSAKLGKKFMAQFIRGGLKNELVEICVGSSRGDKIEGTIHFDR